MKKATFTGSEEIAGEWVCGNCSAPLDTEELTEIIEAKKEKVRQSRQRNREILAEMNWDKLIKTIERDFKPLKLKPTI